MSLTYTWKLKSLKKASTNAVSNAVIQTYWECTGTDEHGNSGKFDGATPFNLETIDPNNFTPYESLTEEIILGWIQGIVVGDYKEHIDSKIQEQIDANNVTIEQVTEEQFPWSVAE